MIAPDAVYVCPPGCPTCLTALPNESRADWIRRVRAAWDAAPPLPRSGPNHALRAAVLDVLGDGQWHTSTALSRSLGASLGAAVWAVVRLRETGTEIESSRQHGYRLAVQTARP